MNWRIQKLEERKKALVAQSEAILEAAAKEDREPTEEETKTLETNRTELEAVAAKIKRETDLAAFVQSAPAERAGGEGGWPGQSGTGRSQSGRTRAAFEDDPNKGFKTPREFLMAVMQNADRPCREAGDERLRFLATAGSDEQGGYSDAYGGFLVPTGFSPQLLQLSPEDDPIGGRTTQIPMTSPKIEINARVDKNHATSVTGGLTVTRRTETQEGTAKRMEMEKVKLSAYSLFGLAYATEEILSDSPISFAALLEAGFRDQFSSHMIDERINGTGVGEFEGIMKSPSLVTVSKEGSQTADTINYLNVVKMRSRCWRYSQAIWLYNHDCLPQLMQLVLPTGTASGVSMWQNSAREGEPDLLFGRPAIATEYCATLGDLGDILLCNWSQYLEGTYQALQSAESIHVRFLSHERTFKFWLRNAGKCWWRSPLTPKKSTQTLSPFVALEAR
jgi:HK97 family phage major capsid protein